MSLIPRPPLCAVCSTPIPQSQRGRPRKTCGDRCRQYKKRKYEDHSDEVRATTRRAWETIRQWERRFGPLTQPSADDPTLTLRDRLLIRLKRGMPIPFCRWCLRPHIPGMGTPLDYCSTKCQKVVHHLREKLTAPPKLDLMGQLAETRLRVCAECSALFVPANARHKYHTDACRMRAHRKRVRKMKPCVTCGKVFERRHPRQLTCKRECGRLWNNERNRGRNAAASAIKHAGRNLNCKHCGKPLTEERLKDVRTKYCNKRCKRASMYKSEAIRLGIRPKGLGKLPRTTEYVPGRGR